MVRLLWKYSENNFRNAVDVPKIDCKIVPTKHETQGMTTMQEYVVAYRTADYCANKSFTDLVEMGQFISDNKDNWVSHSTYRVIPCLIGSFRELEEIK